MYSTGTALTATRWAASWWRTVAGRPLELGRGLGDVETRTEPELKHLAVEACGDACTQAAEVAGAEHDVGEPGENVVAVEAKASRPAGVADAELVPSGSAMTWASDVAEPVGVAELVAVLPQRIEGA